MCFPFFCTSRANTGATPTSDNLDVTRFSTASKSTLESGFSGTRSAGPFRLHVRDMSKEGSTTCTDQSDFSSVPSRLILEKYEVNNLIGTGSFGNVYECNDITNNITEPICIKILKQSKHQSFYRETTILNYLQKFNISGIPKLYYYGQHGHKDIVIMSRLGLDLSTLFTICNRKFTLPTVLKLAIQLINHFKQIHSHDVIHRDVKPHNFLTGYHGININNNNINNINNISGDNDKIYVIDFGLAKYYKKYKKEIKSEGESVSKQHIPEMTGLTPVGTARYASIWTHQGITQSRRDDLEAIGFVLIYFYFGKLPWQGIPMKDKKDKWSKIGQIKMQTNVYDLCNGLPKQFVKYFQYVRNLKFSEDPDYEYMKGLFIHAAKETNIDLNKVKWDWDGYSPAY